jgi:hypothetical protein
MSIRPRTATPTLCLAALAAVLTTAAATAERPGRYTMQPIEGGFLRLDTETGALALCTRRGTGVACEPVEDQRSAGAEIDRLTAENRELKAEVKRLTDLLAEGGERRSPARGPRLELPTEEDVDKALGYMERMLKKFRDKLKDLEGGPGRGTRL